MIRYKNTQTTIISLLFLAILCFIVNQLRVYKISNNGYEYIKPKHLKTNTTLLIMAASYRDDFTRRTILRETYLSFQDKRYKWMFLVSNRNVTNKLEHEQQKHRDIVLLDCADDYNNLTDKILQGFASAVELFNFKYLLKVDTDTYVNVPKFIDYIISQGNKEKDSSLYSGVLGFYKVKLNHFHMYYPSERVSRYMLGGGYAMSYDLVLHFAENWHLFYTWRAEDISVGAHLYLLQKKSYTDVNAFYTVNEGMECERDSFLVNHKVNEQQMYYLHHSAEISGSMCAYTHNQTLKNIISRIMQTNKHKN